MALVGVRALSPAKIPGGVVLKVPTVARPMRSIVAWYTPHLLLAGLWKGREVYYGEGKSIKGTGNFEYRHG